MKQWRVHAIKLLTVHVLLKCLKTLWLISMQIRCFEWGAEVFFTVRWKTYISIKVLNMHVSSEISKVFGIYIHNIVRK